MSCRVEPNSGGDVGDEIQPNYRKEYEFCKMTRTFAKIGQLQHFDIGRNSFDIPSPGAQNKS